MDIVAWELTPQTTAKYLKKGDELLIKGELRNKKLKLRIKKLKIFIVVYNFEFTHGNKREKEGNNEQQDNYLPSDK